MTDLQHRKRECDSSPVSYGIHEWQWACEDGDAIWVFCKWCLKTARVGLHE